ncbi:MAG: hypothetical protein ACYTHJ_14560 [Planctomycetota bacterium]|jgi:hypothetical protein
MPEVAGDRRTVERLPRLERETEEDRVRLGVDRVDRRAELRCGLLRIDRRAVDRGALDRRALDRGLLLLRCTDRPRDGRAALLDAPAERDTPCLPAGRLPAHASGVALTTSINAAKSAKTRIFLIDFMD